MKLLFNLENKKRFVNKKILKKNYKDVLYKLRERNLLLSTGESIRYKIEWLVIYLLIFVPGILRFIGGIRNNKSTGDLFRILLLLLIVMHFLLFLIK